MGVNPGELIIDDDFKDNDLIFNPTIDGEPKGMGLVPRDFSVDPPEMFDPPSQMVLIPRSEWSARIKEMEETKSRISDILLRAGIPSTDQNGHGYCWAYSTAGCVQAIRAIQNQPFVPLNPHSVAAIIKRGADQGGSSGQSAQFLREHGIASFKHWPQHSRSLSNDTPECRANMALHKVTEEWSDLTRPIHGQYLTFDQVMTCLLNRIPVAGDFNWWGHSVLLCDPVEVESGDFGIRLRNSWTDNWGDKGLSVLRGSKTKPDGAIALRSVGGSLV